MYYFRDALDNEVDLVMEKRHTMTVGIKADIKTDNNMLYGLKYWQKLQPKSNCVLINGGDKLVSVTERMTVLPWAAVINL